MTAIEEGLQLYTDRYGDGSDGGAVLWGQEVLKSHYWSKQIEIINAIFEHERVSVKACHSSTKTYTAADVSLAFLLLRFPAKVITTAPTFHQVQNLLWSEIRSKWNEHLADEMGDVECLLTKIEIDPDWFMIGISPRLAVNMTGFHGPNVLIVVDEAPGVSEEIMEGLETLMASGNTHMLKIGNPVDSSGHFYEDFRSSQVHTISISYEDTPNFTDLQENPDPIDVNLPDYIKRELLQPKWVEGRKEKWGEGSPLFQSRCKGEFPDYAGGVIPLRLCEESIAREVAPVGAMVLGVDVGAGGDLTAYARRQGQVIHDVTTQSTPDPAMITQRIIQMHERDKYQMVFIDSGGVGWHVESRLRELGIPATGVNASTGANDKEHYVLRRDELWAAMLDWLKEGGKLPDDMDLVADLTAPKWIPESANRFKVEKKEDTKKRLKHSPDMGDAANLSLLTPGIKKVYKGYIL